MLIVVKVLSGREEEEEEEEEGVVGVKGEENVPNLDEASVYSQNKRQSQPIECVWHRFQLLLC